MKKHFLLPAFICFCLFASAQVPQSINYQAVARNTTGAVISSQPVGLRFSIRQSSATGTVVYSETTTDTTNQFGLFAVAIGTGTPVTGTFAAIDWASGDKFLQVEIDAAGGTNYTDMGTSQLLSVPYALYAEKTAPLGQSSTNYYGTGLTFINATDSVYKLITGLSVNLTVPQGVTTLLQCTGSAYGTQFNSWAFLDVCLFIDGVQVTTGGKQVMRIVTDDTRSSGGANWSINYPITLSAGSHTIEVKAKGQYQSETGITIDNNGFFDRSTLTVTYLRN